MSLQSEASLSPEPLIWRISRSELTLASLVESMVLYYDSVACHEVLFIFANLHEKNLLYREGYVTELHDA